MPILAIGIDGFDTPYGGCTTHLASLIVLELLNQGYEIVDYPWLVRLNPSIPWKTRGNGAVALFLKPSNSLEAHKIVDIVERIAKDYVKDVDSWKAAIVAVYDENAEDVLEFQENNSVLTLLYLQAVRMQVSMDYFVDSLAKLKTARVLTLWHKHGVIGALASLGARLDFDHTFEILVYRSLSNVGKPRAIDVNSVIEYDLSTKPYTFLNYDYEVGKILIAPHGLDPVLYGVRGEYAETVMKALRVIKVYEEYTHWTIFRTNQATDDHIDVKPLNLVRVYDCIRVCGIVVNVQQLPGGHVVARLCNSSGCIDVAFYRETRRLRDEAKNLNSGDDICVQGCVKQHKGVLTLNAEKMTICRYSSDVVDIPHRCPICGGKLEYKGRKQGYYCKKCRRLFRDLEFKQVSAIKTACTHVVASESALHHLVMPMERYTIVKRPRGLHKPSTPLASTT